MNLYIFFEAVEFLIVEFLSSILHLLHQIYPMDPDPYSEYGSGSTKLLNTGTNLDLDLQHCTCTKLAI